MVKKEILAQVTMHGAVLRKIKKSRCCGQLARKNGGVMVEGHGGECEKKK